MLNRQGITKQPLPSALPTSIRRNLIVLWDNILPTLLSTDNVQSHRTIVINHQIPRKLMSPHHTTVVTIAIGKPKYTDMLRNKLINTFKSYNIKIILKIQMSLIIPKSKEWMTNWKKYFQGTMVMIFTNWDLDFYTNREVILKK